MQVHTLSAAVAVCRLAAAFAALRNKHPNVPAHIIKRYIDEAPPLTFVQFLCETVHGHDWSYSGTSYGGDDESFHGEGRAYCSRCGADGDA